MYSINIPNTKQNNKIEHINNEINLLQNRLKIKKKVCINFKIGRIRVKKRKRKNLSQTQKIQNIVKNIFQNKIKQIKKNANLLQNTLAHVKKERDYLKKD